MAAALVATLAARLESGVGQARGFFPNFEANEQHILRKLESSQFR
jgi:hypothetical protein